MTAARCWDVYACPGECIGRSGLWNVAPRGMTCPRCGGKVEPVRVTVDADAIGRDDDVPPLDKGPLAALYWENEAERLRAEWRKADDGWIACRQQLEGAVEGWERAAKLAEWIIRDRREADKVTAYAGELAALASRHGGQ